MGLFKKKHRVLVISDTQFPFQHKDYLKFLRAVEKKYKCDKVIHIGDEVDFHAISNWDSDPDGYSAGDEFITAKKELKNLYAAFPVVKACISNHTDRPYRKAFKHGLPRDFLKSYADLLEAPPGWEWGEYWIIDEVQYEHGEGSSGRNGAIKAAEQNMRSTVIGHIHSHAGIQYTANPRFLIFGFNVGCLIDRHTYAFAYGKKFKAKPIISCGVVIEGIPILIPMQLNARGRWTGKL